MTKSSKKKKTKKPELFLLKRADQYILVSDVVLNNMTPEEAYRFAMLAHAEQQRQLLIDAYRGDHYVDNIKVVDGLEGSLSKLEELYPSMREELWKMDSKIGRC